MAKVKSSGLRNYVGKLGGSVYYMNKGQNVARELAPEVSNPRTPAQMRQRMKWANIVNVYKANKSWMGHLSFEDKPNSWSYYNAFMSVNINSQPVYLTKGSAEHGDVILAPYAMTRGSLAPIGGSWAANVDGLATNLRLTESFAPGGATIAELAQAIIPNNLGWAYGDQLSIVFMYRGVEPRPIVDAIEIILDNNDPTPLASISGQFANLDEILLADDGYLGIDTGQGVNYLRRAVCAVHSRTTNGKTYVSSQDFVLNVEAMLDFQYFGTDEQFEYAAYSYGIGEDYFLSTPDREIAAGSQGIRAVVYDGTAAAEWSDIDWTGATFPTRITLICTLPIFGAVSLRVGGVSLDPVVNGRQVYANITSTQADTIAGATSANQRIILTSSTETYVWA